MGGRKKVEKGGSQCRMSLRVAGRLTQDLADILYTVERHTGSPVDLFDGAVWREAVRSLPANRLNGKSVFDRAEQLLYHHRVKQDCRMLVVDALMKKGIYSPEAVEEYIKRRVLFDQVDKQNALQRGSRSEEQHLRENHETLMEVLRMEEEAKIKADRAKVTASFRRMRQQNKAQTANRLGQKRKALDGDTGVRKSGPPSKVNERPAEVSPTNEAAWANEESTHDIGFIEDPATPLNLKVEESTEDTTEEEAAVPYPGDHPRAYYARPVNLLARLPEETRTAEGESTKDTEEDVSAPLSEPGSEGLQPMNDRSVNLLLERILNVNEQTLKVNEQILKTQEHVLYETTKISAVLAKALSASLSNAK